MIAKFAKKGATPSQIGVMLRDSHGVPQVNGITGSKVLRILKKNGESLGVWTQSAHIAAQPHTMHMYLLVIPFKIW